MKSLTMKHLRYFEALARLGHFGRAAEACAISQPALSVQIKELEGVLGAPLIERAARQIRLTGLGQELAQRARTILRAVDELDDLVRASSGAIGGRLQLGVIPTIAPYLLPRLIKEIGREYPELEVRPREAITRRLVEDLIDCRLDVAIAALPIAEPSLHEETLFDEEFMLVRSREDIGKDIPAPERLPEMPLLLLEEGHCFRDQAIAYCGLPLARSSDLIEGSSLSTLVQMVGAGIGATLIPEMAAGIETRSAAVEIIRLPPPSPSRRIGMLWRKSTPLAGQFEDLAVLTRRLSGSVH